MRRTLLLTTLILLAACQCPAPQLTGSGMDMFAPAKIRLHPLSRILTPAPPAPAATAATAPATQNSEPGGGGTQNFVFEARIEMTDQFSDPTKSPGTLKIELFDQPPLIHRGDLLQDWTFSIDKPEPNRDHWDRTTRTYFFKLPLANSLPKRDHLLAVVTLTLPNGSQLTDEMEMPLK